MMQACIDTLKADPIERLRWYVARELGIAPYCQSDEEVVKCGLHLLMERAESNAGSNSSFDEREYLALKEAGYGV